ncbi:MAG: helix-turn-helix domain-containing protein [Conexivisphaerales archaeon]
MTSRQLEVLRRGLAVGYFDVPRRIGVKKLAKIVGVAPSPWTRPSGAERGTFSRST